MEKHRDVLPSQVCKSEQSAASEKGMSQSAQPVDVQRVMEVLQQLGISSPLERHRLKQERQKETGSRTAKHEVYCKNLLLKDKKGQAYLILFDENDTANLRVVKHHLNAQGNLHFASRETLWNLLRVQPGAVTPLALFQSSSQGVRVLVDASLIQRIHRDTTRLFFHPMKDDLQVGLKLAELERFLNHCGVAMETLPSLISYSAGRRYNYMGAKNRFQEQYARQHSATPDSVALAEIQLDEDTREENEHETSITHSVQKQNLKEQKVELNHTQKDVFQDTGIRVEVIPTPHCQQQEASISQLIPCKCVYMKDKRDSYFLFICHENQKVDFSNLKMQLKPKKKITPLDSEELHSLLQLSEGRESPFPLAHVKQPRFLAAVADNLYQKHKATLTFPHPSDSSLSLKVTLKDLESFIRDSDHDLVTIQVKGSLESLREACSASSPTSSSATLTTHSHHLEAKTTLTPLDAEQPSCADQQNLLLPSSSAGHSRNLFCQLTVALREWVFRYIRQIVWLMDRYLPLQISATLRHCSLWNRLLTAHQNHSNVLSDQSQLQSLHPEEQARQENGRKKEQSAKTSKLQQLMEKSEIPIEMTETPPLAHFLKDDAQRCRTYLLFNGRHHPYFILCTEDDDPTEQNLHRLRTAFKSRSALTLATGQQIFDLLSWEDGQRKTSWTQEELSPLAMLEVDLQTEKRVRVGITGALYMFPDTVVTFDLPAFGKTLRMNCEDMEKMLTKNGFCITYLP